MKDERSRVSRSGNWAGRNKDRGREGERCFGLADTKVCQKHIEVLRVSKLLSTIYSRLYVYS